jgi:hypothetical protein
MSSTINNLVQEVRQDFLKSNRDLLALTTNGPEDVMRRLTSALSLDSQAQADVTFYSDLDVLDQKGFAGEVARADFRRELYRACCVGFLKIQHNLVVTFAAKLTPEALAQLEDIEIAAGVRAPRPIVPPPPPPLTAAEQLEAEVRRDWKHLPSSEIKRKRNNVAYRAMFDKLEAAGQLASFCTSLHDGGREFRS